MSVSTADGKSMTLLQLNQLVSRLVSDPSTQNVWVTAELSDVAVRGGHCYMELLQKDERGQQQARARGVIWASSFPRIDAEFYAATGQRFATGLKVMVRASVSMHPLYGMSLVVSAVDPDYTMGDLLRRRREILMRLKSEGVIGLNRSLPWNDRVWRIAVISAPGAAGYGDFINQLYHNQSHLRFSTRLFAATMQGERAPSSVIAALDAVAAESGDWDCVVLIRGGGATSDLQAFEDYELAYNIANFPLPVIIGIGHERDITVLDYVAKMRVKTPTAAAEWLVARGECELEQLRQLGARILQSASDFLSATKEQLSYLEGLLPVAPINALERADARLRQSVIMLREVGSRRIAPALERLRMTAETVSRLLPQTVALRRERLDNLEKLLVALSPQAVLARGYSITRVGGRPLMSAGQLTEGTVVETTVSAGTFTSIVNSINTAK